MRRQIKGLKRWIERLTRRLSNSWVGRLAIGGWQWTISLPNSTAFWLALVGIVLLGGILGLVFGGWDWFRPQPSEGQSTVTMESRSTTIRNVGFVIGGVVALVFAVWRGVVAQRQAVTAERQAETALRQTETAQRQAETAQQGLLNERYQKGSEMLGSEVLAVRLGGIYALQRLAEEHPEQYHLQIMQLFCAYVRNPTGDEQGPVSGYDEDGEPILGLREDVQAVMYAIGKRADAGITLENADENFHLNLLNADLRRGGLEDLDLSGAFLTDANLSGAFLGYSDLSYAFFDNSDLSGARLPMTVLFRVSFDDADLSNANFRGAYLYDARFPSANLSGAVLEGADLTGAWFNGRDINGGYRYPAKGLTQEQLDKARSDPENPPMLNGVLDAETGQQLVWQGKPLDDDP